MLQSMLLLSQKLYRLRKDFRPGTGFANMRWSFIGILLPQHEFPPHEVGLDTNFV